MLWIKVSCILDKSMGYSQDVKMDLSSMYDESAQTDYWR